MQATVVSFGPNNLVQQQQQQQQEQEQEYLC
jgi:hypothetical protein